MAAATLARVVTGEDLRPVPAGGLQVQHRKKNGD